VELAAVVTVSGTEHLTPCDDPQSCSPQASENLRSSYSSRMPILGNDLLRSWMDRIRSLGVKQVWLTSVASGVHRPGALERLAREGIERFLMIKLKSYAEMDLPDLLRFHRESRNSVTEAQDAQGRLGVALLDQFALHSAGKQPESSQSPASNRPTPYSFLGYAKRILWAKQRQELVRDSLTGACAMRPVGMQKREQVWVGANAEIADSVRFISPVYIGARTIIRAGAIIGPFTSVENDCIVDYGTAVEHSTVLPQTYLAPGLLIRDSVVNGGYLEHLRWSAIADLHPGRLGRKIERRRKPTPTFTVSTNSEFSSGTDQCDIQCDLGGTSPSSESWRQVQL
jgi:hypothetical protein